MSFIKFYLKLKKKFLFNDQKSLKKSIRSCCIVERVIINLIIYISLDKFNRIKSIFLMKNIVNLAQENFLIILDFLTSYLKKSNE